MMTDNEKRELILTVIDVIYNQMDLDRLEEFFTDDFYNHDGYPDAPTGPAAFREYLPYFKKGIPDRKLASRQPPLNLKMNPSPR